MNERLLINHFSEVSKLLLPPYLIYHILNIPSPRLKHLNTKYIKFHKTKLMTSNVDVVSTEINSRSRFTAIWGFCVQGCLTQMLIFFK